MTNITRESGGVCAPNGFQAAGVHCGLAKKAEKLDLALIYSKVPCTAAAMYTQNKVKGAPLLVTREHLESGEAQAILCNSGNANTCNADGLEVAKRMCAAAGRAMNLPEQSVLVASTGVIGQPLAVEKAEAAMPGLAKALSAGGSNDAVHAIMTTDLMEKEIAVSFMVGEKSCRMGGIAKGSGMIHPNMATMLAFITTDVKITAPMLDKALRLVTRDTFNMISVDGDTSTNDMITILANGLSGCEEISGEGPEFDVFVFALMHVCIYLARMMAKDGEGATKLLECSVSGAPDEETARVLAKSVICSSLFKSAMFGADANWGRALCALGYADAQFDITKVGMLFESKAGSLEVCRDGAGVPFDEATAKTILSEDEIEIKISLDQGSEKAVAWGCDLTYDYVKINGDYRS